MEKKSDAQLARKIEVALPVELSREDQITLLQKYIAENFTSAGMCADMAIHKKHVDGKTIIRESTVCCTNVTDSIENDLEIKRLFFSYVFANLYFCELFKVHNGYIVCKTFYDGRNTMTDKELMQKVYGGNQEALSDLIELYYADIFRFCLYMIQSEDDAYDITQETFLKFIKYSSAYRQHNLKGYLLTIARNLCFSYFRMQKERSHSYEWEILEKIPVQKDSIQNTENSIYLQKLLSELSPENREVVILRTYEELKFKDIAKMMGCSVSTIKSRFRLCVQHLKKMMEDENGKS